MTDATLRQRVLDTIQSGFPIASDPYGALAETLNCTRDETIESIESLLADGTIHRVGASFASAKLGYVSTLCALAVPPARLDEVAAIVSRYPGITHNYARENRYNLWFTLIAPSRDAIADTLADIRALTGCDDLLNLPVVRLFKIRVDFGKAEQPVGSCAKDPNPAPRETPRPRSAARAFDATDPVDIALVRWAQENIVSSSGDTIVERPFHAGAQQVAQAAGVDDLTEADVIKRLKEFSDQGVIRRFGAMVRHRKLGYAYNGMVVWDIEGEQVEPCGTAFARMPFVSHCYERPRTPSWPRNVYTMVHAKTQDELNERVALLYASAKQLDENAPEPLVLVSTKEYKKSSMRYFRE